MILIPCFDLSFLAAFRLLKKRPFLIIPMTHRVDTASRQGNDLII